LGGGVSCVAILPSCLLVGLRLHLHLLHLPWRWRWRFPHAATSNPLSKPRALTRAWNGNNGGRGETRVHGCVTPKQKRQPPDTNNQAAGAGKPQTQTASTAAPAHRHMCLRIQSPTPSQAMPTRHGSGGTRPRPRDGPDKGFILPGKSGRSVVAACLPGRGRSDDGAETRPRHNHTTYQAPRSCGVRAISKRLATYRVYHRVPAGTTRTRGMAVSTVVITRAAVITLMNLGYTVVEIRTLVGSVAPHAIQVMHVIARQRACVSSQSVRDRLTGAASRSIDSTEQVRIGILLVVAST